MICVSINEILLFNGLDLFIKYGIEFEAKPKWLIKVSIYD